ncbi:MAG TPA: hypothetical protein VKP69_24990 [Isosphaeraceae bacterium]|nr:hypothetical protein [Isosphaeraceae bacterium]
MVIGERPLQLALAAAARDPVEQEILAELLRQRKPAQMQSARDLSPDVLLAYQEQRKPEVAARNLAYIPSSIPYFDITEVRPLCWETGDFVLFLHDLRNAKILLQPFSLTKDSPRNRERIAGRLQAVVPEVVRTVLQPEPPPAGAADGVEPVPAARFRR